MVDELKVQVTLTAPVRVSFPQVFEAKNIPSIPSSLPVYSARFVFDADHPDLKTLLIAANGVLRKMHAASDEAGEELGKLQMNGLFVGGQLRTYKDFWWPFTTGDAMIVKAKKTAADKGREYKDYDGYMAGKVTLYTKAYPEFPPQLDVFLNGRYNKLSAENRALHKAKFFNGMEAFGSVSIAGTKTVQGWGVTAYLNGLAATGSGERIGGRADIVYPTPVTGATTDLNPLADEVPFYASTKPAHPMNDDEIPF